MPCRVYPAVALSHVRNTPTAYVEVVLVLEGKLDDALAVDNLAHEVLREVAEIDTCLASRVARCLVFAVEPYILCHSRTAADEVHVVYCCGEVAKLAACLGIVEVNLTETYDDGVVDTRRSRSFAERLTPDGSEDRIVVRIAGRSGVSVERHDGVIGARIVEVPPPVLECYAQIEARFAVVELLHDRVTRTRGEVGVAGELVLICCSGKHGAHILLRGVFRVVGEIVRVVLYAQTFIGEVEVDKLQRNRECASSCLCVVDTGVARTHRIVVSIILGTVEYHLTVGVESETRIAR